MIVAVLRVHLCVGVGQHAHVVRVEPLVVNARRTFREVTLQGAGEWHGEAVSFSKGCGSIGDGGGQGREGGLEIGVSSVHGRGSGWGQPARTHTERESLQDKGRVVCGIRSAAAAALTVATAAFGCVEGHRGDLHRD